MTLLRILYSDDRGFCDFFFHFSRFLTFHFSRYKCETYFSNQLMGVGKGLEISFKEASIMKYPRNTTPEDSVTANSSLCNIE